MNKRNENRPGYKKTKAGWIPEEWELVHIGQCAEVLFSNVDKKSNDNELPVKLCNYTDVYYNKLITNNLDFMRATATKLEIEKFSVKKGDVIITKDSETADDIAVPAFVVEKLDNVLCGYHLALIRPNNSVLLGEYLSKFFQLHTVRHYFSTLANGVTRFGLTTQTTLRAQVPLPPLPEQKKIAEILSAWDSAVKQRGKLINAKTKLKKALMQQLLTGKRRFNEFVKTPKKQITSYGVIPADWDYPKIGNIAKELSDRNTASKAMPVLSCTKYDGLVESLKYFGRQIFSKDTSTYKVVKRWQFAYATNHIEEGSIGILDFLNEGLVSPMYTVFQTKEDKVHTPFLYKVLKTELYRHIFEVNTSGSINRRGSLRWKHFSQIHIPLPSVEEQKKIFECIVTCEREIKLLEKQAKSLKKQKKGLMQKLLTGTIRVKI